MSKFPAKFLHHAQYNTSNGTKQETPGHDGVQNKHIFGTLLDRRRKRLHTQVAHKELCIVPHIQGAIVEICNHLIQHAYEDNTGASHRDALAPENCAWWQLGVVAIF